MSDVEKEAKTIQTSIFLENLVKLIPVEIIALFAVIKGLIPATAGATSVWIVFGLLTALVPFYVVFAMNVKKWDQVALMTIAFPIWAVALGGLPSLGLSVVWLEPWMMSVALALFTLVPPMFYGKRVDVEEIEEKFPDIEPSTAVRVSEKRPWREVI